jgi:hypothetical protein
MHQPFQGFRLCPDCILSIISRSGLPDFLREKKEEKGKGYLEAIETEKIK